MSGKYIFARNWFYDGWQFTSDEDILYVHIQYRLGWFSNLNSYSDWSIYLSIILKSLRCLWFLKCEGYEIYWQLWTYGPADGDQVHL